MTRKTLLLFTLLIFSLNMLSQQEINNGLWIKGQGSDAYLSGSYIRLGDPIIIQENSNRFLDLWLYNYSDGTWKQRFTFTGDSKFGIGISSPKDKLHIRSGMSGGNPYENNGITIENSGRSILQFLTPNNQDQYVMFGDSDMSNRAWVSYNHAIDEMSFAHYMSVGKFTFYNGTVGIGTSDTKGFKLAVKGKIGSEEVQVNAPGYWPDFVFAPYYNLKSLSEVESFIEENNHLPDIPSEKEVKEKGINLGDMDAKLLQKIEELTLYVIELNKETKALKKKNEDLQTQIDEMRNK